MWTLISKSGQIFREIVKQLLCFTHTQLLNLLNTEGGASQWVLITIYFVLVEVLVTFKFCNCFDIFIIWNKHVSVQVSHSYLTLCDTMDCSIPGFPVHHQLPELTQTHVHRVGDTIQPSHPLLFLPLPPSIFPCIRVFFIELALHIRWSKYWSFSMSPSNEYSELTSFRIDRFDLLSVQGTLKSLLQHCSSKASILWYSAYFTVQLSRPYLLLEKL